MKLLYFLACTLVAGLLLTGCDDKEENADGNATLQVRLTDAPADYEHVYIDVLEVRINSETEEEMEGEESWQTLENVEPGIYDLLELTNGKDTLLGEEILPPGSIRQIRLILGDQNSLVQNGEEIMLTTPSAQQSGLKLNVNQQLEGGFTYTLLLDFDAARSIVKRGNSGKYNLKPVIRAMFEASSGSIAGVVRPLEADASVFAIQGEDSVGALPDSLGNFLIQGLDAGTYDVYFEPVEAYTDSTLTSIEVTDGQVTELDTMKLVQ
jgi:hypothetical protein